MLPCRGCLPWPVAGAAPHPAPRARRPPARPPSAVLANRASLLLCPYDMQWHKKFLDALLRPEDWKPPAGRSFAFRPADVVRLCELAEAKLRAEPTLLEVSGASCGRAGGNQA